MLPSIHHKRLFDYFIIVSARTPSLTEPGENLKPCIIHRFPEKDHEDYALPQDIECFAQPEGCAVLGPAETLPKESVSFVFMLTDVGTNERRFGVCVQFYRPILAPRRKEWDVVPPQKPGSEQVVAFMLTTFCIITHHTFFNSTKECIHAFKLMFMKYMGAVVNEKELFRNSIPWSFSFYPADFHPTGFNIQACTTLDVPPELSEWVENLLVSPAPSKENEERLCLRLFNKCYVVSPVINFCYPDNTRLLFSEFCVHLPLELLGVDGTIEVLTYLILEQKVVLSSENYSHLSTTIYSLIALLYPLEYIFNIIPVLPVSFYKQSNAEVNVGEILRSPMPYLFGVPASFFAANKMEVPDDVVHVNLDTAKITRRLPMPSLPEPHGTDLCRDLKRCLQLLYSRRNPRECLPGGPRDLNTIDVEIRVAMIKFFMSPNVLGKHKQHVRIVKLYPRPITHLQKDSFLRNCSSGKPSLFLSRLTETSCLQTFGEAQFVPRNTVVQRILSGVTDQRLIGDKLIWFSDQVEFREHNVCPAGNTLGIDMLPHTGNRHRGSQDSDSDTIIRPPVNVTGLTLMQIAQLAVQPGMTVDSTRISPLSDIALEPETSFNITSGNPIVDDFNPYRSISSVFSHLWPGLGLPEDGPSYRIDLGDDTDSRQPRKISHSAQSSGHASPATSNTSSPVQARRNTPDQRTLIPPSSASAELSPQLNRSNNEDVAFISKVVNNVLDGAGVAWYQNKKLSSAMCDENLRLLVSNRLLSGTTSRKHTRDLIQHEQTSVDIFRGIVSLLRHAVKGLENTMECHTPQGIGSMFTLLEIAYTRHMGALIEVPKLAKSGSSPSLTKKESVVPDSKVNGQDIARPVSSQATPSPNQRTGSPRGESRDSPQATLTPSNHPPTPDCATPSANSKGHFEFPPSAETQAVLQPSPNPPGTPDSAQLDPSLTTMAMSLLNNPPPDTDIKKRYIFEELLGKTRSPVWDREDMWESMFYDAVHFEREALGMNRHPIEMLDRYEKHSKRGRERLENDEDELLYSCINNMAAFMAVLGVETRNITRLISRLEGKTHIGLKFNAKIRHIKECLGTVKHNELHLKPLRSQLPRTSYLVHQGTTLSGETLLLEISAEAIFIRSPNNMSIKERYFLEDVRRVSYSKKYKIMSLWVLTGAQQSPVTQIQFCSQKSAEAYNKIKESFKRIKKTDSTITKKDSIAEFKVQLFNQSEVHIIIEITQDHVKLRYPHEMTSIPVSQIFRVTRNKESISLDALVEDGQVKPYVFRTAEGSAICDRILTAFERMSLHKPRKHLRAGSREGSATSDEESSICLSSPEYQFISSDEEP